MRGLQVRPEAEADAFEAALWYEAERPGLGAEFLEAVRSTFERIEEAPLQFPLVLREIRRAILQRFPTVVAVAHLHRHPSMWERRG